MRSFLWSFSAILGRFKSFFRSFFTSDSLDKIVMAFYLKSHLFISSATSHPILRRSHHRSRHGNAPAPPMIIVFILVTSPVRARRATPRLLPFHPSPISPPNPQNLNSPPSVSPKIPTPHFHQISLPSALSPHRLYDSVECNGVGEEWPCAILRNPKWHEMACSRRNLTETRKQPTGYNV